MEDEPDPLMKLVAVVQYVGDETHPTYVEVVRGVARRLDILEYDEDGHQALRRSHARAMRTNLPTFGNLAPRGARSAAELACIPERTENIPAEERP